ncbi:BON domain-containing protein [Acidovorax sp. A1169]|uniref:BON domain-containing protein n=1 Tax=Acidovorax sp. A1169 TaxID=3059524 RepID=UPI002737ACB1|nr:BON domain-containing protein [Acidovorax sp. A1169]MDP4078681.1 BON domain-containing protein [Acidovorax sp. A1169]
MRSDLQIQQDVHAELRWEPSVHAAWIEVLVRDGIVSLLGHVCSYSQKMAAEHAVQRVAGVRAVAVKLEVRLEATGKRPDDDIAVAAKDALNWTAFVPKDRVTLSVLNGTIILSGDVDWAYQRVAALTAVHYLQGVISVDNQITVKPRVAVDGIQNDIEAALARRAHSDAHAISVSVRGSAVILTGTVSRWGDRELAIHAAWSAPGVYDVVDNLEMAS